MQVQLAAGRLQVLTRPRSLINPETRTRQYPPGIHGGRLRLDVFVRIAVEQLKGKSSFPLLLYFLDTAEYLFGPQLERGLIVIRLGLVGSQQDKLAFKNRIVVEIGERNVMNVEILVWRQLVVQV